MAARLQPAFETPVIHEKEGAAVRPRHDRARRDVIAHGAREGVRRVSNELSDPRERFLFRGVLGAVRRQRACEILPGDHLSTWKRLL